MVGYGSTGWANMAVAIPFRFTVFHLSRLGEAGALLRMLRKLRRLHRRLQYCCSRAVPSPQFGDVMFVRVSGIPAAVVSFPFVLFPLLCFFVRLSFVICHLSSVLVLGIGSWGRGGGGPGAM